MRSDINMMMVQYRIEDLHREARARALAAQARRDEPEQRSERLEVRAEWLPTRLRRLVGRRVVV